MIAKLGRHQLAVRIICAGIISLPVWSTLAAIAEWHIIGDPPRGSPPPTAFVISPLAPNFINLIDFIAPIKSTLYFNDVYAAETFGIPFISVVSFNHLVNVTFTPPLREPIPMFVELVSGIDGNFGLLDAGTWASVVFSISGTLISSNSFVVDGPVLGIERTGDQIVLSWPVAAYNYGLLTAPEFSSASWTNVTNGIANTGSNFVFKIASGSQKACFRLQRLSDK